MYSINMQILLDELAGQEMVVGLFMLGTGLVFMLLGTRMFRGLVAVSYGMIGFVVGGSLPVDGPLRLACALLGAVGLAMASTFQVKGAVALLAGGWAALTLWLAASLFRLPQEAAMVAAGFGFAGAVSLTFIIYDEVLATITSLQGALLCIGGLVTFMSYSPTLWSHVKSLMLGSPIVGPFMIVAGTVTGLCLQLSDLRHKSSGVSM